MTLHTNDIITVPRPRRGDAHYGSGRYKRWLSRLLLTLGLMFVANAQAFKFPGVPPSPNDVANCGGNGQRACHVWEAVPTCDSGLAQNHVKQTCGSDVVGKWTEKAVEDVGNTIITAGESIGKFSEEQIKKAGELAKKGYEEAQEYIKGLPAKVYEGAAKEFLGPIQKPLENMTKLLVSAINEQKQLQTNLKDAVEAGDGDKILSALKALTNGANKYRVSDKTFALIAQDLKDKNAGSLLVVVGIGGGAGVGGEIDLGIAIDIDYLIAIGKGQEPAFKGPKFSLFAAAGGSVGVSAGGGVDLMIGYNVADPNGVSGPSFDLSLEMKVAVGGSLGVGFDMTKTPWMANTAAIGVGKGVEIKFAVGGSYAVILGLLCHDNTFIGPSLSKDLSIGPSRSCSSASTGTVTKVSRKDFSRKIDGGGLGYGQWKGMTYCPPDTYATGYSVRVEGKQGKGDDTGANSVTLACKNLTNHNAPLDITPHKGFWGSWHKASCLDKQLITGFQAKVERPLGGGDDTALNTIEVKCDRWNVVKAHNGHYGTWRGWNSCPVGTAVCGVDLRIEDSLGGAPDDDDTALNNVSMACCTLPQKMDALVSWGDGKNYFFRNNQYVRYDVGEYLPDSGYPRGISQWEFPVGWDHIDAAVQWGNGYYFFRGDQYVYIKNGKCIPEEGYPKPISNWNFPGWKYVDAAVKWDDGYYFFKGNQYVLYKEGKNAPEQGYPKPISVWKFPPGWDYIDAAVQWGADNNDKNNFYFFKGNQYVLYKEGKNEPEEGYPRLMENWKYPANL